MPPSRSLEAADGRWPQLLMDLAGLHPDQLEDRHQPCPSCMAQGMGSPPGGTDRYRWDGDDGPGSWFCSHCGGKDGNGGGGTGIGLLMRIKGWDFKTAARAVEAHLGIPSSAPPSMPSRPRTPKRPARIPDKPPADATPPTLDGATAQWCYRDAAGDQLFWIQRVPMPGLDGKGKPKKLFVHRTWIDGRWHRPSKKDPFTSEWPAPRPLYNLHLLAQHPDLPVLLTEGEKDCDAAADLFSPSVLCLSWSNGSESIGNVDLTPLAGRRITLWPDADDKGRLCMAKLAPRLLAAGAAQVRIVQPPADVPEGWGLADATWSVAEARAHVAAHRSDPITLPEPAAELELQPADQARVITDLPKYKPFECLGFDADHYYYQPHRTGQVVRLSRSSHTGTNLVALAPIDYWETIYPSKTGTNWTAAASDLFAQQAAVGIYSPDRIRGRGAWWDQGRAVLHLGDRLRVDGTDHAIADRLFSSYYLYQRLASIEGLNGVTPLSAEESFPILDLASRFHWEVPASGLLLAGWTALAPICGALEWRPHVWLTAAAGSGKSAILDRYIGPLLGPISLWPEGNTTEAFIRQELRADALPVVFDEAESNEKKDQERIQSILSLARVASSSGRGVIGKGGADGASQRFTIRSMFLMSSIATALKQGADKSRFAQLTLRNPSEMPKADRLAHWTALDRDLDHAITDDIGRRLFIRTTTLIPIIRDSIKVFRRVAAEHFDSQRLGDQYGTLLAGAWSLMSDNVPTTADARALIDQNDWNPYSQATEVPDERRCIQRILQHQIRVEAEKVHTRTIGELVEIALHHSNDPNISATTADAVLGRHGIRAEAGAVIVSNNSEAIAAILRETPWSNCWPTVLARLSGATKAQPTWFRGAGTTSRGVRVPIATIDRAD